MIENEKCDFVKPVAAFVTFNSQEGMERCINEFETKSNFFGSPIYRNEVLPSG